MESTSECRIEFPESYPLLKEPRDPPAACDTLRHHLSHIFLLFLSHPVRRSPSFPIHFSLRSPSTFNCTFLLAHGAKAGDETALEIINPFYATDCHLCGRAYRLSSCCDPGFLHVEQLRGDLPNRRSTALMRDIRTQKACANLVWRGPIRWYSAAYKRRRDFRYIRASLTMFNSILFA